MVPEKTIRYMVAKETIRRMENPEMILSKVKQVMMNFMVMVGMTQSQEVRVTTQFWSCWR
jgi:hypothetical protein